MINRDSEKRRHELAEKFARLSDVLMLEALEKDDAELKIISGFLSIMASVVIDTNDIKHFASLVSMYSANKLLSGIQSSSVDLSKYQETLKSEEFDRRFDELRREMDEEDKKKKDEEDKKNSEEPDSDE